MPVTSADDQDYICSINDLFCQLKEVQSYFTGIVQIESFYAPA